MNLLTEIALDSEGDAGQRATRALEAACDYLGVETGIISRITGDAYTVHWHVTKLKGTLENGATLPLHRTYCSLMLKSGRVFAIDNMGQSSYRSHECYEAFGLESYLAAPVWVDDRIFGTINFSSPTPRTRPFTATDKMFVTLLARWVADIVYQQEHTETLNKLMNQVPGMLYQYQLLPDGRSTFPYTSPGIQNIYGISAEDAAKDASPAFSRIHPEDVAGVADSIQASAETLQTWQHKYRVTGQDDTWRWVEGHANPEALPDGSVLWHGYISDIHERQMVDEMKNQFISTVSHELRTPLTSISGSLDLLLGGTTGKLSEKATRMLEIAKRNSEHLKHLIGDLLDIEKLVSGNMPIEASNQDVGTLVEEALEEMQPMARRYGVAVKLASRENALLGFFDRSRLAQAITNLVSNAVKFSPDRGVVNVSIKQLDQEIRIEVKDEGPGVPESFRDRIFQKFAQANGSSSRSKEGTGLGLAITRELMHAMGGEVGFDSEEGKGACFWLSLPLAGPKGKSAT